MSQTDTSQSVTDKEHSKCFAMMKIAVSRNKKIQKLIDTIESLGCELPKNFISCRKCDGEVSGGFTMESLDANSTKHLPQNKNLDKTTFENTISHELVHALDVCRAKLDFKNCYHHACTEIRASSMSGECEYLQEFLRGTPKFRKGHQTCVSRRAQMSVAMNEHCSDILAKTAVAGVFKDCYADIYPFEHPP